MIVQRIVIKDKGPGLEAARKKDFEEFVRVYALDIAEKWMDYFIKKKHISPQIITTKVKNVRVGS